MKSNEVVVWPGPPCWTQGTLLAELRKSLRGRVQSAWLIGSHATGTATDQSDVDLILVCRTVRPWSERWEEFADLFERFPELDLLIYTPGEWARLQEDPTPFLRHAAKSWKQAL